MKKLIIALAVVMVTAASYGQGVVVFNNRVGTEVNARVLFPDGTGVTGPEWTAQLYGGPAGGALAPLLPSTTFRTGNGAGFVVDPGVSVAVPGVAPGAQATLVLRAFTGGSFETSQNFGSSEPITIALGGGTLPPTNLTGLQGFSVTLIPEPSTYALAALGLGALVLFRRRK